jgi:hypothetical protein
MNAVDKSNCIEVDILKSHKTTANATTTKSSESKEHALAMICTTFFTTQLACS